MYNDKLGYIIYHRETILCLELEHKEYMEQVRVLETYLQVSFFHLFLHCRKKDVCIRNYMLQKPVFESYEISVKMQSANQLIVSQTSRSVKNKEKFKLSKIWAESNLI